MVDGRPVYKFHHQVRSAVVGDAAIQKTTNMGMVKRGQNLALGSKACLQPGPMTGPGVHQFNGYLLLELFIGARGQIDRTHASFA